MDTSRVTLQEPHPSPQSLSAKSCTEDKPSPSEKQVASDWAFRRTLLSSKFSDIHKQMAIRSHEGSSQYYTVCGTRDHLPVNSLNGTAVDTHKLSVLARSLDLRCAIYHQRPPSLLTATGKTASSLYIYFVFSHMPKQHHFILFSCLPPTVSTVNFFPNLLHQHGSSPSPCTSYFLPY